jgi:hypothetical protein
MRSTSASDRGAGGPAGLADRDPACVGGEEFERLSEKK